MCLNTSHQTSITKPSTQPPLSVVPNAFIHKCAWPPPNAKLKRQWPLAPARLGVRCLHWSMPHVNILERKGCQVTHKSRGQQKRPRRLWVGRLYVNVEVILR